mmetsp:Transcript_29810/g.96168  ORF Transcript_29810/g.96168 Transcript_29810/m.96168 type:complete len:454 (+) Transcript_29810:21-1382(+)
MERLFFPAAATTTPFSRSSAGFATLKRAQQLDQRGRDQAGALRAYEDALALLLTELKTEGSPQKKKVLKATIERNMSRAEELKKKVRRRVPPDHHDYTRVPRRRLPVAAAADEDDASAATETEKKKHTTAKTEHEAAMLKEMVASSPGVSWEDVAGLEVAKRTLKEAVVLPYVRPDLYRGLRAPPKGVLLYGPPGTGKTMLAKAVATESGLTFFSASASSLTSKWVGEGEKLVRALFDVARAKAPSCVFLDEVDSLLGKRGDSSEHEASRRLKNEFLVRLDGLSDDDASRGADQTQQQREAKRDREDDSSPRVLFIGATNLPWQLDDAVLRRLPRRILIPLPDLKARRAMLDNLLDHPKTGVAHRLSSREKDALADATPNYSMAELRSLAQEAALGPLRDLGDKVRSAKQKDVRPVSLADFENALFEVKPSCDPALLHRFDQWTTDFGVRGGN